MIEMIKRIEVRCTLKEYHANVSESAKKHDPQARNIPCAWITLSCTENEYG
jgi:hypothetical protein